MLTFFSKKTWAILITVFFLTATVLEKSLNNIRLDYDKLLAYKNELALQKTDALALKLHLERQIMSQSDPQWITLTLIRELGVVPEGQTKVYFKKHSKN